MFMLSKVRRMQVHRADWHKFVSVCGFGKWHRLYATDLLEAAFI